MSEPASHRATLRRWPKLLLGVALLAPLVATPYVGRALADHLGQRGGAELAGAAARLDLPRSPLPAAPPVFTATEDAAGVSRALPADAGAVRSPAPADRNASAPAAPRGILIRADVVARAIRAGVRPSGTPVPPRGTRPAGLALHGVQRFGSGLRDGDVLTSIAGEAATSADAAVLAVMNALGARVKVLSAVVWRGEQRIQVTVELPASRR